MCYNDKFDSRRDGSYNDSKYRVYLFIDFSISKDIFESFQIPVADQILLCSNGVPYKVDGCNTANIYVFDKRTLLASKEIKDFSPIHDSYRFTVKEFSCDLLLFQDHLKTCLDVQSKCKEMFLLIKHSCQGTANHLKNRIK